MKLPLLPSMPQPDENWPALQIGDYYLGPATDGGYWIEHESGEGMHVRRKVMEKLIKDFYRENF